MSFWTTERDEQFKTLYAAGVKLKDIAPVLGARNIQYLSMRAKELGLKPRCIQHRPVRSVRPMARSSSYLEQEAQRRAIGVPELIRRIMQTVTKDKMVNAILDDDVPEVASPTLIVGALENAS